jgi:hypothetical protein
MRQHQKCLVVAKRVQNRWRDAAQALELFRNALRRDDEAVSRAQEFLVSFSLIDVLQLERCVFDFDDENLFVRSFVDISG